MSLQQQRKAICAELFKQNWHILDAQIYVEKLSDKDVIVNFDALSENE